MSDHMLPPQKDGQPRPPVRSKRPGFNRRWFGLARVCSLALMLLVFVMFLLYLPAYNAHLQTLCTIPALDCTSGQLTVATSLTVQSIGLSLSQYALALTTIQVFSMLANVTMAALLLWRTSRNWMALLVAFTLVMNGADYVVANTPQPHILWSLLSTFTLYLSLLSKVFILLLFPNGLFVPRWSRWLALAGIVMAIFFSIVPLTSILISSFSADLWVSLFLSSLATQIYRYRCVSTPLERQQTKVVIFAFAVFLVELLVFLVPQIFFPSLWTYDSLYRLIGSLMVNWSLALLLPLVLGVAILRYRLYDIDILINRTLVYGTLTLSIVGIYVLVVGSLGALLQGQGNSVISLLATGLVAVLFQPVRDRLQHLVNRLMYGDRHTPYQAIARLGERLQATLTSDAVLPTIVETVAHALKLPYVAMSLKQEGASAIAASFGVAQEPLVQLPLLYQGESVGELLLASRAAGEAFSSADRRLLEDLARHAGIAAHTVSLTHNLKRLTKELQCSRTALVTAREEERRRLRRDLHDGMGSTLASLNWQAGALRQALTRNQVAANALIVEQQTIIRSALADIRRLVYDLRPPSLDELGLVGALRERAAHTTLPTGTLFAQEQVAKLDTTVEAAENIPPLPAAIEVAVYRIVQEALTNVVRHAHAATCRIRLSVVEGSLHVEVTDDGVGLGLMQQAGVGLLSMRERAAELGGKCHIQPGPRGGTHVCASLPFPTSK
jgi:signal transduction histidine kinase